MCDEPDPCRLRVRATGDEESLRRFLRKHPPGCGRAVSDPRVRGQWSIEAEMDAGAIPGWVSQGLAVEVLYDLAQRRRELSRMVGKGNRFAKGERFWGLGVRRQQAT